MSQASAALLASVRDARECLRARVVTVEDCLGTRDAGMTLRQPGARGICRAASASSAVFLRDWSSASTSARSSPASVSRDSSSLRERRTVDTSRCNPSRCSSSWRSSRVASSLRSTNAACRSCCCRIKPSSCRTKLSSSYARPCPALDLRAHLLQRNTIRFDRRFFRNQCATARLHVFAGLRQRRALRPS